MALHSADPTPATSVAAFSPVTPPDGSRENHAHDSGGYRGFPEPEHWDNGANRGGGAVSTPAGMPVIRNRLRAVLLHVPWYMIEGQSRLAADMRVSRSTVSRLINGRISPSYRLVEKVTDAVSRRLGWAVDARDLFTTDGSYLEPSVCLLCGCSGCLPPWAWDERRDLLKPDWKNARPGDWCLSGKMPPQQHPQKPGAR